MEYFTRKSFIRDTLGLKSGVPLEAAEGHSLPGVISHADVVVVSVIGELAGIARRTGACRRRQRLSVALRANRVSPDRSAARAGL
jgi:hypothetical protein